MILNMRISYFRWFFLLDNVHRELYSLALLMLGSHLSGLKPLWMLSVMSRIKWLEFVLIAGFSSLFFLRCVIRAVTWCFPEDMWVVVN